VERGSLPRTVLTATLTVLSVVFVLVLVYLLRKPIAWIIIAGFLAVALAGPVAWLSRFMRRGRAILVTYLFLILTPMLLLAIIVPPIVRAGSDFVEHIPEYSRQAQDWVQKNKRLHKLDQDFQVTQKIRDEANKLPARAGGAASWLGSVGLGIVNSLFAGITILILSVFMLSNGRRWLEALLALQPPERAARIRPTLEKMGNAVGAYIAGALFQALVAGITTYIVLMILGVPFAAPLAVIMALFDLIPLVGATIGAVIIGVLTLFATFPIDTIIWTVWAIAYQQIENTVIQPRIQNRAVGIHPFGVIVAVLFGSTLFGVPGALIAVPVAAMIQIGIRDWWQPRVMRPSADPAPG
jgi:predicted PurR-regulated permease PerM